MKKILQCLVVALVFALCFGQLSFAATRHFHVAVIPGHHSDAGPAAGLYGVAAFFGEEPLNQNVNSAGVENGPGATNYDPWDFVFPGTAGATPDVWPCFGGGSFGTADSNPDCQYIGSSSSAAAVSLPAETVVGAPAYTWYLTASTANSQPFGCDATTTGDVNHFCAQAINYYEDDSGDSTDDLLWSIVVTQGTNIIYDSGIQDYGTNPYGGLSPAATIVFYEDLNFGLQGGTGALSNDGPCFQSYNYPPNNAGGLATYGGEVNTFGAVFGITAGKTCVAPTAGPATVTITTELATPTWTPVTKASKCNATTGSVNTSSPYCYTVKYATPVKANVVSQKFPIWLE